jgi:FkbM family methyltransferase
MTWFYIRYSIYPWKQLSGIYIPVYPSMGYSVLRFLNAGKYELGEINIIKKTLESKDRVLELGTGLGFISAYCSRAIGNDMVTTYEANPYLENNIRKLYKRNNTAPHLKFAMLGNKKGEQSFYISKNGFFTSSALPLEHSMLITVPVEDMNECVKKIDPTYLVMDIEGGEFDIFSSIKFNNIRKIQFELHPKVLGEEKALSIFRLLEANGFVKDHSLSCENNFFYKK